jgi:hypothetical protein
MHRARQMFWSFQLAFHESLIDHDFRCDIREFEPLPSFHSLLQRFKVPLHPIDTD